AMISNSTHSSSSNSTASHGHDDGHDASACTNCAQHAAEAQQWQSAYLQLERQFVKLQLRIDEVDTMSSLSRHGSMARSRAATTSSVSSKPALCQDQGVGQGSVCDRVNRIIQTSPDKATLPTTDACVATNPTPSVTDDAVQTDTNLSLFAPLDVDDQLDEESPQSSELLTVIPPAIPSTLQSLSSSSSSSWVSTAQSMILTEDHASQTSCSFLATCASTAAVTDHADSTANQHVARRKYRRHSSLARTGDGSGSRPRPVSRRIRGLAKRPIKQRPLAVVQSDTDLADYSDVSEHETSGDADAEPSGTLTSGSDTEGSRTGGRSVTPTQKLIGRDLEEEQDDDDDDESSSRGEPLEFASDSSMSQPRPPTPPLASRRTRYVQQQHIQASALATPPISPSDGSTAHSSTLAPACTANPSSLAPLGAATSSDASTRSIAPSSANRNNASSCHSSSSMSISISDSMLSMSDPPLVAVHGPVPESGSPLGMAAPRRGGVTTDDDEDDKDHEENREKMLPDTAPTLLSLLESPAHSFNVLTVSRIGGGGGGGESVPETLERNSNRDEVPTLSRGTRLDIDLSRLSTITEMSSASVATDPPSGVAASAEASSGADQPRHAQPPLPPMAWPRPPSTTPPPPSPRAIRDDHGAPTSHVPTNTNTAPMSSTSAVSRSPLVQVSPPLFAESSPVSRKKSKSKKRSNASSKLGSLMPRRQPTNTSTSSSAATVSDSGVGIAHTVTSSQVSLSSTSGAAGSDEHHPKEKVKGWKAVTSFVTKVKDKVRDKVQHKSHSSSTGKNTVFAAPDGHTYQSPPTSRRSSLAQLVGLGSHHHASSSSIAGNAPLSPTSGSIRAVYGPFHHGSPATSNATIVSTVLTSDSESSGAPLSPRSVGSMLVAGGSSRGTPRPTGHATVGVAAGGTKMYQSQQQVVAAAAYGSAAGGGGASGAVVGRAPPHAGGSVSMSAATGGMVAAAAYTSHLHQYQQQKQAQQQVGSTTTTNNLRPWLGPPPLTKSNSAPGSPHTAHGTLATTGAASNSRHMPQSMSVPELYSLAHAPTPRHTATASVPIMFPKPVKALGTPKVLLADPLEPSPNMRISMVTLESQPDSTSSRTPSPSLMSLKSDVPLITPENAPPVPPLVVDPGMSLPRSLHLTDVDADEDQSETTSVNDRPLQRTHRPGPGPNKVGPVDMAPPEVLTLDDVADQIPVDVRSIASSRISLVLPAPSAGAAVTGGATNQYVHPAAAAAGSA
ncbi:hypothetical protein BCR44DRAFT_39762, partial [Catenaria anguillulae PL171]